MLNAKLDGICNNNKNDLMIAINEINCDKIVTQIVRQCQNIVVSLRQYIAVENNDTLFFLSFNFSY